MKVASALLGAGLALAAVFGGTQAASADVYAFSFVADVSDPSDALYGALGIAGDFYTSGSLLPAVLTDITGKVTSDGMSGISSGPISGLSGYANADNTLYGTGLSGQVSLAGISFNEGSQSFNLYAQTAGDYALAGVVDGTGYAWNGVVGALTVKSVPEPTTWAMMLLGFAGLGVAGYRRTKNRTADFTAA